MTETLRAQQRTGYFHCDIHTKNVVIHKVGKVWRPKIVDLGLSVKIPEGEVVNEPDDSFDPKDYNTNYKTFSHVAPEILKNKTGDTYASETFAVGALLRRLGKGVGVRAVIDLARRCQELHPKNRPSLDYVIYKLKEIVRDMERRQVSYDCDLITHGTFISLS